MIILLWDKAGARGQITVDSLDLVLMNRFNHLEVPPDLAASWLFALFSGARYIFASFIPTSADNYVEGTLKALH